METIHQSDRGVFQFILVCRRCDDAHAISVQQMQVHQTEHGGPVFNFKDVQVKVKYQMMLIPKTKKEVVTEPPLKIAARTSVKDGMAVTKASLFEVKEHKTDWHVCQTENEGHVLSLDDEVDAKYQEKGAPTAKKEVNKLLSYLCRQWRSRSMSLKGVASARVKVEKLCCACFLWL